MAWQDLEFDILSEFAESQYLTEWRLADIRKHLIVKLRREPTEADKLRKRKWARLHPEYYRDYYKAWYARNKEYVSEQAKAKREKRKAERPAVVKKPPLSHKERCARYRERHREEINARQRKHKHEASLV